MAMIRSWFLLVLYGLLISELLLAKKRDYYDILGLHKDASDRQIKKAFHKLAKKYHPDKNKSPGAEAKFREIAEAYETLLDDKKRREYDQFGHGPPPGATGGWGGGGGSDYNFQHHYQSFNFDDWFKDFDVFSHQQQQQHRQKNHVQGAKNKHKSHRSKQGSTFGVFEDLFSLDGGRAPDAGRQFHGSGEQQRQCRTVTQRRGNMVSTYTVCS